MIDRRLRRHPFGFLEVVDRPTPDELAAYYAAIASGRTHDLVWLGNVMEHGLDPVALLSALRRLVAPGAILGITAPDAARLKLEALIGAGGTEAANRFYSALAGVGLGRNPTAFLRPVAEQRDQT